MANPFEIIGQELPKFLKEMNVPFTGGDGYRSVMDPPDSGEVERKTNEALLTAGASAIPVAKGLNALFKVPGMASVGFPVGLTAATGDPTNLLPGALGLLANSDNAEAKLTKANLSPNELTQLKSLLGSGDDLQKVFQQMKLARVLPIDKNNLGAGWERFTSEMPNNEGMRHLKNLLEGAKTWKTDIPTDASRIFSNMNPREQLKVTASYNLPHVKDAQKDNTLGYMLPGEDRTLYLNAKKDRDLKGFLQTLFHERQHDWDNLNRRSSGFSPDRVSDNMLTSMNNLMTKYYPKASPMDKNDVYRHNIGEARARLNALLETEPEAYQGLNSNFGYFGNRGFPSTVWKPQGLE